MAAKLAFDELAGIPTEPMRAMEAARYGAIYQPKSFPGNPLTLGISVSGTVARTREAMAIARAEGALTVAITANPDAPLAQAAENIQPTLPPTNGHHRDWIDAIKGGPAASSNFEYAARLTEITLLGVLSLRLGGQKVYWDAENLKAHGIPAADAYIREPVRKGWEME